MVLQRNGTWIIMKEPNMKPHVVEADLMSVQACPGNDNNHGSILYQFKRFNPHTGNIEIIARQDQLTRLPDGTIERKRQVFNTKEDAERALEEMDNK